MAAALRARLMAASTILDDATGDTKLKHSRLQRLAFANELGSAVLTPSQIADLSVLAESIAWAPGDLEIILELLDAKAGGGSVTRRRRQMQDYLAFMDYIGNRIWRQLGDKTISVPSKQDAIVMSLIEMKCVNPCEHTLKLATSLYLCAVHGMDRSIAMSSEEKGRAKALLKSSHKRHARKVTVAETEYVTKLEPPQQLMVSNRELLNAIMPTESVSPTINSADVHFVSSSFRCRDNGSSSASALARRRLYKIAPR